MGTSRCSGSSLTYDLSKLLVVYTGRKVNGQDRYGVAMIDTNTKQLLPWRTRLYQDNLQFMAGIVPIHAGCHLPRRRLLRGGQRRR